MVRSLLAGALALGLTACGSPKNGSMGGGPDLTQSGPDLAPFDPGPYPMPPEGMKYGKEEGDVVYNMKAKGWLLSPEHTDASELDYQELALGLIRENPQCKCLMLAISATWCAPCNAEQPHLVEAVEKDPSFCVFNVLMQGLDTQKMATKQDVLEWTMLHGQNYPVVGYNIAAKTYLPSPEALPTNFAIRPETMKILAIGAGVGPRENGGLDIPTAKQLCAEAAP